MQQKFLDYLEVERRFSPHTIKAYRKDIADFFKSLDSFDISNNYEAIEYGHIRSWIVSLSNEKVSIRSINRKLSSINSFFKFLQRVSVIKVNPMAKHLPLKATKNIQIPFTAKELEDLLDTKVYFTNDFEGIRNKLIIDILYSTGMRKAELIGLKYEDINFKKLQLKVIGKGNKERWIPFTPLLSENINKYMGFKSEIKTLSTDKLMVTARGSNLYPKLVYNIVNSYLSKVSTKLKKSPHILRHSYATHLLNNGLNLNLVKELLGHESLTSTQEYLHTSIKQLKQVYNRSHPREQKK